MTFSTETLANCGSSFSRTSVKVSHHIHCTIFLLTTTANHLWTDTLSHAKLAAINTRRDEGHVGHVQLRWRNFIFMRFKEIHGLVGPVKRSISLKWPYWGETQSGHKSRECMPSGAKQVERLLKSEESGKEKKALIPPTIHRTGIIYNHPKLFGWPRSDSCNRNHSHSAAC